MRYTLSYLLLFTILLPSTLAALNVTRTKNDVFCSSTPVHPIELVHCYYLIADLLASPWYSQNIRYGTTQPLPGRVPRHQDHRTCRMELFATPEAGASTEEMMLADDLDKIDDTAWVGKERKFKVYMGGLPLAQM